MPIGPHALADRLLENATHDTERRAAWQRGSGGLNHPHTRHRKSRVCTLMAARAAVSGT